MEKFTGGWMPVNRSSMLKTAAKALVIVVCLALAIYAIGRFTGPDEQFDTLLEEHRKNTDAQLQTWQSRVDELEQELVGLRDQFDELEQEIQISIKAREEEHDAIDDALSIDDVDAIIKHGIRGASGRRPR